MTAEKIIFRVTGKNIEDAMAEYIKMKEMCNSIKPITIKGVKDKFRIDKDDLEEISWIAFATKEENEFYIALLDEIREWATNLKKTHLNNNQVTSCANFILDKLEPGEMNFGMEAKYPQSELANRCLLKITNPKESLNLFNDMLKTFDVLIEWSQELMKKYPENKELAVSAAFIKEICNCGIRPPKERKK